MKKIFAAVALLSVVASPALAATAARHHAAATAKTEQTVQVQGSDYYMSGSASTDPDAFIRRSLLIEGDHNFNN